MDPKRTALPFSRVTVYNSSEVQTHIIIDRHSRQHVLRPGDRKRDVELPNEDIEYFQRERRPDRFFPSGEPKPQHPIVIEGSILGGRYE